MVAAAIGIGSAVAGIGGSLLSSSAASSAANTQAQAADQASANTLQQFHETEANLAPFVTGGENAFNILGGIFDYNAGQAPASAPAAAPTPAAAPSSAPPPAATAATNGASGVAPNTFGTLTQENLPDGGLGFFDQSTGQFVATFDASGTATTGPWASPQDAQAAIGAGSLFDNNGNSIAPFGMPQGANTGAAAPAAASAGSGAAAVNPLTALEQGPLAYNPANYGLGNGVFNPASVGLGNGTFQPTQAQLEATPGYQFDLSQGLLGAQNGATAQGLGVSGAAMKAGATYATGLANNTLTTQDQIYNANLANAQGIYNTGLTNTQGIFQQNLSNIINPLMSQAQLGENAAAQTGTIGANAISAQSNLLTGAANAQAAGTVGAANAASSGLSNVGSSATNYLLYNNLLGGGGGGGGAVDSGAFTSY